jgi:4'-phosphopantetheinyl transferase
MVNRAAGTRVTMVRPMAFPRPTADALAICWTDVRTLAPAEAARWAATLPDEERARFHRYRHPRSAAEFLAGRLLLRRWLAAVTGMPAAAWRLVEGPRGRPAIASPTSSLQFNLAHSGGVVACILTDHRTAGVDVEDLGRRWIEPELWRRYCAPSEVADIETQPEGMRGHRFLQYWTLKEAYLKARGLGIAVTLADVAFRLEPAPPRVCFEGDLAGDDDAWAFGLTSAGADHLLSWATPQPPGTSRPPATVVETTLADLAPDD